MSLQGRFWKSLYTEDPEDWKKGNVIDIFEEGKKEDCRDYRLVSLTLIPRKGMEQVMLKTVSEHIKGQ